MFICVTLYQWHSSFTHSVLDSFVSCLATKGGSLLVYEIYRSLRNSCMLAFADGAFLFHDLYFSLAFFRCQNVNSSLPVLLTNGLWESKCVLMEFSLPFSVAQSILKIQGNSKRITQNSERQSLTQSWRKKVETIFTKIFMRVTCRKKVISFLCSLSLYFLTSKVPNAMRN